MVKFSDLGVEYMTGTYDKKKGIIVKSICLKDCVLVKDKDGIVKCLIK